MEQNLVAGKDVLSGPMSRFPGYNFRSRSVKFADYTGATREQDVQEAIQTRYYSTKVVEALFERSVVARIAVDITEETSHPAQGLYAYEEVALTGTGVTDDTSALETAEQEQGN